MAEQLHAKQEAWGATDSRTGIEDQLRDAQRSFSGHGFVVACQYKGCGAGSKAPQYWPVPAQIEKGNTAEEEAKSQQGTCEEGVNAHLDCFLVMIRVGFVTQ